MNIQEMHIGLGIGIDKVASLSHDSFQPEEKDYFLNRAIEEYVKQQYSFLKAREKSAEAQFVNENLHTVIKKTQIYPLYSSDISSYQDIAVKGDLPNDYRFHIFSRTQFADGEEKTNRFITSSTLRGYLPTKTNKPLFRELPIIIQDGEAHVIRDSDDAIIQSIEMLYIKNPAKVSLSGNISCNLPEHTHQDIVNLAVDFVLEDIKVLRPQGQQQPQQDR